MSIEPGVGPDLLLPPRRLAVPGCHHDRHPLIPDNHKPKGLALSWPRPAPPRPRKPPLLQTLGLREFVYAHESHITGWRLPSLAALEAWPEGSGVWWPWVGKGGVSAPATEMIY